MEKEYNGIEADSSPPLRKGSSQLLDKASIRGTVNKLVTKGELNRRKEDGTTYYKKSQLSEKEGTSVIKKKVKGKTKKIILIKPNKCSYYSVCKGKNKGFRSVCETTENLLCEEEAINDGT
ncbi:MAG TPA: hypothetical protein ENH28_02280 [Euryarchaeota archaeon]|nr:hypothetical protein [Euryarchaeota archaeon]